ncbi:MAG TPA: hypothetical protein VF491_24325 [Vicinamibacterales bacterium]|jgi:hypothetical protein
MESRNRLAAVTFLLATAGMAQMWANPAQGGAAGQTEAAAIKSFEQNIAQYMALRESLIAEKITGPVPNSTAPELNRASDVLAAAIQRARTNARPGDLFVASVTPILKQRIVDVVRAENLGPVLAGIDDEPKGTVTPAVHMRFPVAAPLATMPPSLLAALPPLPKSLEYRIVGRFLVLRDVDAALIVDFIPAVVPR